jgi:hypothetical protein
MLPQEIGINVILSTFFLGWYNSALGLGMGQIESNPRTTLPSGELRSTVSDHKIVASNFQVPQTMSLNRIDCWIADTVNTDPLGSIISPYRRLNGRSSMVNFDIDRLTDNLIAKDIGLTTNAASTH